MGRPTVPANCWMNCTVNTLGRDHPPRKRWNFKRLKHGHTSRQGRIHPATRCRRCPPPHRRRIFGRGCLRKTRTTSGLFTEIPTSSMRVTKISATPILGRCTSRQRLSNGMMIHHPRMFRRRDFNRTHGFDERIKNAVDFDFFLKLSELTTGYHLQMPMYLYRQHDENTSKVDKSKRDRISHYCVRQHLERTGLSRRVAIEKDPSAPRKIIMNLVEQPEEHRLDCSALFGKFGFRETVGFLRHRWELDHWISQHTSNRSRLMLGQSSRFLRLGPYGSVRVADAVAGRLMKEYELSARSGIKTQRQGHWIPSFCRS